MPKFAWLLALICCTSAQSSPLITEYKWKYLDYVWKSKAHKAEYVRNGLYNHQELLLLDVDRPIDGRTFVTAIAPLGGNVPASLSTVSKQNGDSGPLLKPYPDWSWHEDKQNCDNIINAFRVAVDKCNRLWVMDCGIAGLKTNHRSCPARLFIFDLKTDRLLSRIVIPDDIAKNANGRGLLDNVIVETYGDKCENTTAYLADVIGYGLVVWTNGRMYRLEGEVFEPEEQHKNITVAKDTITVPDGVVGMSLSPILSDGTRYLYFRPVTSLSIYAVETHVLRDGDSNSVIRYLKGTDVFTSQALGQTFSSDGRLLYGLSTEMALGCWNINKPLIPNNFKVVIEDERRLQFIQSVKVVKNWKRKEQALMVTDRFQKFFLQKMNFSEINYRILRVPVDLIKDSDCDIRL